jgi:hypothetical protein
MLKVRHVRSVTRFFATVEFARLARLSGQITSLRCQDQFVELGNPHPVNTTLMLDFNFPVEAKQILALVALEGAILVVWGGRCCR